MIIETRMEKDWETQVSKSHSKTVGKAVTAPSLRVKMEGTYTHTHTQSHPQRSALPLLCKLPLDSCLPLRTPPRQSSGARAGRAGN